MKTRTYLILNVLTLALGIPIIASIAMVLAIVILEGMFKFYVEGASLVARSAVSAALGGAFMAWLWGRFARLPDTFGARYFPTLCALLYTLAIWLGLLIVTGGDFENRIFVKFGLLAFLPYLVLILHLNNEFGEPEPLLALAPLMPLVANLSFALTLAAVARLRRQPLVAMRGKRAAQAVIGGLSLSIAVLLGWQMYDRNDRLVAETSEKGIAVNLDISDYQSFSANNRLTSLSSLPTLRIERDWPKLNGATAFYPIYAAAAQAIYQNLDKTDVRQYVDSYRTPYAYEELIKGNVDMIFVLEPSASQRRQAEEHGVSLAMRPFAREAFVFVTHKDNPVSGLAAEQVRAIYSGRINGWSEVGGPDERIFPYQRSEDSGSQTTMLATVMKGKTMRKPLEAEVDEGMYGLIRRIANYQNRANSLGYTFLYYTTQMKRADDLRLLAIDGVEPTVENIRNGSYPFTVDVYMVTTGKPSANTQALIDWFLSPQGQKLVEDVGYVAMGDVK